MKITVRLAARPPEEPAATVAAPRPTLVGSVRDVKELAAAERDPLKGNETGCWSVVALMTR